MTLAQAVALRDKYYNALMKANDDMMNHDVDQAEYRHDDHRDSLQKAFTFWDNIVNAKLSAGRQLRLNVKAT